jgi:hypothetical protein
VAANENYLFQTKYIFSLFSYMGVKYLPSVAAGSDLDNTAIKGVIKMHTFLLYGSLWQKLS